MIPSLENLKMVFLPGAGKKKNMIWIIKFGVLLTIFLIFFLPVCRDSQTVSSKKAALQTQISDIKKMSVNLLKPEELAGVKARLKEFDSKLIDSSRAASLLDSISTEADKGHLKLIQIYSDNAYALKNDRGQELSMRGKKIMLLPVNFRVEADYKSFGNFLRSMRDSAPAEFVVESMDLKKASPESESLQCDVTVSFVVV